MKLPFTNTKTGRAEAVRKARQGEAGYDNPRENIDPHIKTQAISAKEISAVKAGDHSTDGDIPQIVNVVFGTDATPPTASTVPFGTIYIQYIA